MRRRQFWVHTAVLSSYTLLAFLLTWPLVLFFGSHVPGDGIDDPALAWNLWWIKARLIDQLRFDIFHVDWLFFPIEINLGFYTLTPLNGLLSVPLQTGFTLITASNLILLSSFVLGGYGTFLLVRYLLAGSGQRTAVGGRRSADGRRQTDRDQYPISNPQSPIPNPQSLISNLLPVFAAGIVYAFASSKLFYASLGQFNIASSQWIPFTVLYVIRAGQTRRVRDAALAALFLTLQAWSELTYASFLLIFIVLYFLWTLASGQRTADGGQRSAVRDLFASFLLIGALFTVGISPFLWAMAPDLLREGDFFASGGGFADIFSADLMGYLLPTRLHPLLGDWVAALPFPNDKGQQIFLGYSTLALGILGGVELIRRQGWRGLFWPLMALFFWWLTLGADARWAGQPLGIPGPFALISQLPFFSGNRYPSRYTVMLMLAVAVLVGWGLARINELRIKNGQRLPLFILHSSFILLFLFEHLSTPLPLNDFRVPPIYAQIAAEPGDFTVLELPTGWRNGARVMGKSDVLIMMQQWYQTDHGKRRLGGNTSRNPAYKFQYFTEATLIGDLIALMNDERGPDGEPYLAAAIDDAWPGLVARNRETAPFVLDFLNVRFVTVHVEKSPLPLLRFVEEVLPLSFVDEWQGPDWTGAASTIRLYRVDETPQLEGWALDFGSSRGQFLAAEGWSVAGIDGVRYATRAQADLLLDLPAAGGSLRFQLFGPAALTGIALNGEPLTWVASASDDESQIVEVQIPLDLADQPVDRLSLRFDRLYPLAHLWRDRVDGWPIGTTGVVLPVDRPLLVRSAGKDAGDFAQILLAGENVAQSVLGYNLVALDPRGGVLESVAFNTLISPSESMAMADWLAQWPIGVVIAGAVRDEASYNLGEDAVTALRGAGVVTDLRGAFRGSHAFIGVIGASAGSALEAFSPFHPATVALGPPVDAPQISGGVGRIEFAPSNR
ncbi:MAG: hypothetical protein KF893_14265 [Caldilineaceae bacterium]|nr:hypothetical protein [Caldilineaceae bacterium]